MTAFAVAAATAAVLLSFTWTQRLPASRPTSRAARWSVATGGLVACLVLLEGHLLVLALMVGAAGAVLWSLAARGRARRAADVTRIRVIEACEVMSSELRAGHPPVTAVGRGAEVWPPLAPVHAAARLDADVPAAFRRASSTPGADVLREVASSWQVSQRVGAGLANALDRGVDHARGRLAANRVVASELASAQATARMVAVLPILLLVVSDGSGADPWQFLLLSSPGLACLGGGLVLACAGMWWIDRIVTAVQRGDL